MIDSNTTSRFHQAQEQITSTLYKSHTTLYKGLKLGSIFIIYKCFLRFPYGLYYPCCHLIYMVVKLTDISRLQFFLTKVTSFWNNISTRIHLIKNRKKKKTSKQTNWKANSGKLKSEISSVFLLWNVSMKYSLEVILLKLLIHQPKTKNQEDRANLGKVPQYTNSLKRNYPMISAGLPKKCVFKR